MSHTKVLITNIVSLNIGDAAILQGTMEILRKKYGDDVEITVFDKSADTARKYYPWANFRSSLFAHPSQSWIGCILVRRGYGHWINRFKFIRYSLAILAIRCHFPILSKWITTECEFIDIQKYTSADLILSSGGTYLIENYDLSTAILDYYLSIVTGNQFGFFTQTLGPFKKSRNRSAFRKIFSRASVILLRDERSKKHILELGIEQQKIHMAADAAFVLAEITNKFNRASLRADKHPRLAISVRSMSFFQHNGYKGDYVSYIDGMVQVVKVAVENFNAKVTFLSTCQGIPEYWTNDSVTAEEIYAKLPENILGNVNVDREFRQPREVVDAYQAFDIVIATRMHSAILALCAGTPTLGIAYEFKMEELFKKINMPELALDVGSFTINNITESVEKLFIEADIYRPKIKIAVDIMYKNAWLAKEFLP